MTCRRALIWRRRRHPTGRRVRPLAALLSALALWGLAAPTVGWAGGLRDVVRDLYGGDGIRLEPTPPPFPSHDPHFTASSFEGLDSLNQSLTSALGILSLNSTVTGFTFDIETGVPERTTDSLGPLLAERAPTLGAKKLNLGLWYTRIVFKQFEGEPLDDLLLNFTHEDSNGDGVIGTPTFESDVIRVDLNLDLYEDVFALFGTYGLTRHWDVGVVVPIVHVHLRAQADATIVRNSGDISTRVHNFGPNSDSPRSTGGGDATGIGDVILRTKYNFLRNQGYWPDLAVAGQIKLPTGDEDNLLGTGETEFLGVLVASRTIGPVTPHLNLGYELSTGGSQFNNLRYVVGLDAVPHPRFTLALDVLGRWEPDGDGIGDNLADVAIGGKWNVFKTFVLSANVMFPINPNAGLRADVIWALGAEYTF
jgi:hypothetical protein